MGRKILTNKEFIIIFVRYDERDEKKLKKNSPGRI